MTQYKRTVYVGGLGEEITEDLLRAAFIPFGDIVSITLPLDQHTQLPRGYGFVEYEEVEDAKSALDNMQHSELFGKVISCSIAKPTSITSRGKAIWTELKDQKYIEEEGGEEMNGSDNE